MGDGEHDHGCDRLLRTCLLECRNVVGPPLAEGRLGVRVLLLAQRRLGQLAARGDIVPGAVYRRLGQR